MKPNTRTVLESPLYQGKDESIAYELDTTNWGGSPTSPSCAIYNDKTDIDLSSTNLEAGTPSIAGNRITSQRVIDLKAGVTYRLEYSWTSNGNTQECFAILIGQK